MRKMSAASVLALFGLAPALGSACEYEAATSASATPPAQLASVQTPAASKAPAPSSTLKATAPKNAREAGCPTRPRSRPQRREGRGIVRQLGNADFKKGPPRAGFFVGPFTQHR